MAVPPFVAGAVLTAAQLNALMALGKAKRVTATGNITSTDLPAGQAVVLIGWAGGGGSGGVAATTAATNTAASGGGSSGAYAMAIVPYVSVVWPLTATIGAGGAAGAATPADGGAGGNTLVVDNNGVGTTWLAVGGGGGGQLCAVKTTFPILAAGTNAAGTATTGTFQVNGALGGSSATYSVTVGQGGYGAGAPGGGGGQTPTSMGSAPRAAVAGAVPGGGAAGAANTGTVAAAAGAAGGRGEVWAFVI